MLTHAMELLEMQQQFIKDTTHSREAGCGCGWADSRDRKALKYKHIRNKSSPKVVEVVGIVC